MSNKVTLPDIGRVVEVVRGRDSGLLAVVVGRETARFVWISDGDKRRAEKPKKKNALHLRSTAILADDVVAEIATQGRVTNARLRHTLKLARMAMGRGQEEMGEGGISHGQG